MNIKNLMEQTDTSERELRIMVVHRLKINEFESESLFESYVNNQYEGYEDTYENFLTEFYRDLGTDYDDTFEEIELIVLENILNNNDYLD